MRQPVIPRPSELPRNAGLVLIAGAVAHGAFSVWYWRARMADGAWLGWLVLVSGVIVAVAVAAIGVTVWRRGVGAERRS